jgi:hypothetical protein
VRCQVGSQDVRQDQRVPGVGLLTGHRVPVPVPRHCHRVDREHLPPAGPQARDQQTAAGLDRHRDQRLGAVTRLGEQLQEGREPRSIVVDPTSGQQPAGLVDHSDVVVILGPVDPAEHRHTRYLQS